MKNEKLNTGEAKDNRHRDIEPRTFDFALRVVRLCQRLHGTPGVGRTLAQQLLRAGTSVGANVEEAQAGQSRADFINKLNIALKESREAHYWLRLLSGSKLVEAALLAPITQEADEIKKVLGAIVRSVRRSTRSPVF
jgi:four helix bundle protein